MDWWDRMNAEVERRGWSIPRLAEAMGRKDDTVFIQSLYKYSAGEVKQPRGSVFGDIAKAIGLTEQELRYGLSERPENTGSSRPNTQIGDQFRYSRQPLPVFGQAVMGEDGKFLFNGERVGEALRPPSLDGVRDAYAVYAYGTSMLERIRPGELLHVHPHIAYSRGDDVVAQIVDADNPDGPAFGYAKRFISFSNTELVLEQLNPPEGEDRLMRFPRRLVKSVHRIVGFGLV